MIVRCASVKSAIGASNIVARQNTNDQEGCRRRDAATTQSSRGKFLLFSSSVFVSFVFDFSRLNASDNKSARSVNLMMLMMVMMLLI